MNTADMRATLQRALDQRSGTPFRDVGDAPVALAQAPKVMQAEYEVPFLSHAQLEPLNCAAQVKDGQVTVWCPTQVASLARWKAAQVAGVSMDTVTLHVPYLGGGFGRRLEFDMVEQAVAIALTTEGRPVKLTWSRDEDTQHDFYRPMAMADFKARLGPDGKPLAWLNQVAAPSLGLDTMKRVFPKFAMDSPDKNHIEGAFELPYALPNITVRQLRSEMPVPVGSWRRATLATETPTSRPMRCQRLYSVK
jgi:isoquinoline 1-oxidoreductase beta subunit